MTDNYEADKKTFLSGIRTISLYNEKGPILIVQLKKFIRTYNISDETFSNNEWRSLVKARIIEGICTEGEKAIFSRYTKEMTAGGRTKPSDKEFVASFKIINNRVNKSFSRLKETLFQSSSSVVPTSSVVNATSSPRPVSNLSSVSTPSAAKKTGGGRACAPEYPMQPPRKQQTGSQMGKEIGDFGFGSRPPLGRNGPLVVQSGMTGAVDKHEDGDDDAEDGNGESGTESESVEEGKDHERGDKDLDPPASGSEDDQSHDARKMRTQNLDDDDARTTAQGRVIMKDSMLGGNKISIGCLYMVREFPPKILSFIITSG